MLKMSDSSENHGHAMGITEINGVLVAYRSSGLYYCSDSRFLCNLHTVGKGEESIRGHHGPFQVKFKVARFLNTLHQGIHPGGLSHSRSHQLPSLCKNNGI